MNELIREMSSSNRSSSSSPGFGVTGSGLRVRGSRFRLGESISDELPHFLACIFTHIFIDTSLRM
jgi:hypothetical protein